MWYKLPFCDVLISILYKDNLEVYVTDFVTIWYMACATDEFLKSAKCYNEDLEIEDAELLTNCLDMLDNVNMLKKVELSYNLNNLLIINMVKSYGYPLRLKLCLTEGSKEMMFQKVTYPLLKTVEDFKKSQDELCNLLMKKDKEIKEYKEEGGRIALRHLKTPIFDKEKHMKLHPSYSDNFKFIEVPKRLLEQCNIMNASIKQETNKELDVTLKQELMENRIKEHASGSMVVNKSMPPTNNIVKDCSSSMTVKQEEDSQSSVLCGVSPRKKKKIINL